MRWRSTVILLAGLWLMAGWGCGPQPDLKAVKLIPGISGFYDDGVVKEGRDKGQNRLLPSVTFQLKNEGSLPVDYVDLTVAFWRVTDDGEKDSKLIQAIDRTPLAPGATTDTMTVRSDVGYTSPAARAEFFLHKDFVDFKVKVFARRAGSNVTLGELPVDRRVLPAARQGGLPQ
jgi:hypothetical protein